MQTRGIEYRLHEGNGFGAGIRVALLSEGNIRIEARIVGIRHFRGGLVLKVDKRKHRYMHKGK